MSRVPPVIGREVADGRTWDEMWAAPVADIVAALSQRSFSERGARRNRQCSRPSTDSTQAPANSAGARPRGRTAESSDRVAAKRGGRLVNTAALTMLDADTFRTRGADGCESGKSLEC